MPKFVIEREIPGAGQLSPDELKELSQKSCAIMEKMGPDIQWLQSYVTGDKMFCVYSAPDEETVREHARAVGLPVDHISKVTAIIDPSTAGRPVNP